MLGVRLTKYQQIHLDIQPAAQQSLHVCLHIDWSPYCTFKVTETTKFLESELTRAI